MATVVGTLQVDLVANTATFTYDLDQGGKAARKFGADASEGFGSAREGAMLLEDATGVRLPRALTGLLSRIGPLGTAFSAMLPVAGVVAAIGIIGELITKHQEATEKMRAATENFNDVQASTFRGLDNQLLEAGIKADELAHDHLGALTKELQLINNQSLSGLVDNLDKMSKAADSVFAGLKANVAETWLQISHGSAGAAHALQEFKSQYDSLISQGKTKEAHDLLVGTLNSATEAYARFYAQQDGHGSDAKELQAQQQLVDVLKDQLVIEDKRAALKQMQQGNAQTETSNKMGDDADKAFKQQAEMAKQAADAEEKAFEERYKAAVSALQESEKQKIDATKTGSLARIAAIDAAIKEEESKGLQETAYFKGLELAKVQAVRERADQQQKLLDDLARSDQEHQAKMAQIANASEDERAKFMLAMRRSTADQALQVELASENRRFEAVQEANAKELAELQKGGEQNAAAIQKAHNKIEEETKQHQEKLTEITDAAERARNSRIMTAENNLADTMSQAMARTLVTGKNFGQQMEQVASQAAQAFISHALEIMTTQGMQRASDAKTAAAGAYAAVSAIPVVGPFLAPEAAAGAFAAVMAFDQGGIVPGVNGGRDSVNAMVGPEEMILPKPISTGLQKMIRDGGPGGGGDTHNWHIHTQIHNPQALDSDGMQSVLERHGEVIQQHITSAMRKMNH